MTNTKAIELKKLKKTGNTFVHTPDDPATLPVPHQILLSEFSLTGTNQNGSQVVRSSMQERELKVLFFLLHAVFDELEIDKMHEIDMYKVHESLKTQYGIADKSIKWVWDSVEILKTFNVKWIENIGDERWDCIASLIPTAKTNSAARKDGVLQFRFNRDLVPVLKEQSRFSRMRLHFLMSLSGKYSIILYGIFEGLANQKYTNSLEVSIETLRKWLKIEHHQYPLYNNLKTRVIEPSIKQINKDPVKSGISVSYEPIKRGRKVISLKFTVEKDHTRTVIDADFKKKGKFSDKKKAKRAASPPTLNPFNIEKLGNMLNKEFPGCDKYAVIEQHEPDFRKWLYDSGKSETVKSFEAVFIKYLKGKQARNEL